MKVEDRIKYVYHKGKRITYVNYSGFSNQNEKEFIEIIDKATQFVLKSGQNQLAFINVEGAFGSKALIAKLKEDALKTKPYLKKQAVVGIDRVKAILLSAINLFAKFDTNAFKNEEEAFDWLVK